MRDNWMLMDSFFFFFLFAVVFLSGAKTMSSKEMRLGFPADAGGDRKSIKRV